MWGKAFVWLLALRGALAVAEAAGAAESFPDEPPDALIRRMKPHQPAKLPAGLALAVTRRRLDGPPAVRMDPAVTNTTPAAVTVGRVVVADWSFPAANAPPAGPQYKPLGYRNDTWYGSTYWTGPNWTRVGKDWHHPGIDTPAVRRFTVPRDGRVTVRGRVYKAHLDGDGVRASIRHGRRIVWRVELKGKDARGAEPDLALSVRKGEAIRFVVHKLGRIFCDTTRWDPVVTYEDSTAYRASAGFSTRTQGDGGWSYEMLVDAPAERRGPRFCTLSGELFLRDEPVETRWPVHATGSDAPGLVLLRDATGRGGIALGVGAGTWRASGSLDDRGALRVRLAFGDEAAPRTLKAGESLKLPPIVLVPYRGGANAGLGALQRIVLRQGRALGMGKLKAQWAATGCEDLALAARVLDEWRREDQLADTPASCAAAASKHLARARRLLADLRRGRDETFLAAEALELDRLAAMAPKDLPAARARWLDVRWLKRRIALANPLMRFGELLFCKRVPTSYSHLVMQYFGWRARPGGGLFVLARPGKSLACRDLAGGKLEPGNVLEPSLSYDGRRVVFSHVACGPTPYRPEAVHAQSGGFYHVYQIGVDGTGLRQLTDGPYDDLMPAYLPDGGIVFSSTRRRGYARCFGGQFSRRWHVYTLHRMACDGSGLRRLSSHDTNEWFPTVLPDGRVLYARWDYIDRDAVTHQNLWTTRPDGSNPATLWGNATKSPHCAFQAKAIPSSGRIVFTASAHHSITAGSIAVVDPSVDYDGHAAITRITTDVPFPEAESRNLVEYYSAPWPLSERYFLVAYSPLPLVWEPGANPPAALGIYLLDAAGNRELIYRDPDIGCTNPIPLGARPMPPALPSALDPARTGTGEMVLTDVYQGLGSTPRGSVKALRIVQVFPKTTPWSNNPRMGVAGEENGRAVLGTVPVEPDGSARFLLPARTPVLFQALNADGLAVRTMRSLTYVQPGEATSCIGCHESRMTAPASVEVLAKRRAPSRIAPGPRDGRPFSYVETVQPVLDKHCIRCHSAKAPKGKLDLTGAPAGNWTRSYVSLTRDARRIPRYAARNQVQVSPVGGAMSSPGSGLIRKLRKGHSNVKLTSDDLRRLGVWIDCNAIFYGHPDPAHHEAQRRGQPVPMPEIQ